jgi:uncharacterized membrane-anchored protein
MSRRLILIIVFAVVAVIQLAVPLSMIVKREIALRDGVAYKFRTEPVDPSDAFRGRYVALRIEAAAFSATNTSEFENSERVYARLDTDTNGFAHIMQVTRDRPANGDYIKTHVQYAYGGHLTLECPFDRYYLPEQIAPEAERAYRGHNTRTNRDSYVVVRVRSGFAVLEDLILDGQPIKDFVREHSKKP